ncbi:hypothetical protein ACWCOW_17495 [Streptomyces sp. NPDC001939]
MSERTKVPYTVESYSEQQASRGFRDTWLRLLPILPAARWWLASSKRGASPAGVVSGAGLRLHGERAERARIVQTDKSSVGIEAVCLHHGGYSASITLEGGVYLDLATLYRNLHRSSPTPGRSCRSHGRAGRIRTLLRLLGKPGAWTRSTGRD